MASSRDSPTPARRAAAWVPSPQSNSRLCPSQASRAVVRARSGRGMVAAVPSRVTVTIPSALGRLPALADVHPGGEAGVALQLGDGQLDGRIAAARRGEHRLEPLEGLVQVDLDPRVNRKG